MGKKRKRGNAHRDNHRPQFPLAQHCLEYFYRNHDIDSDRGNFLHLLDAPERRNDSILVAGICLAALIDSGMALLGFRRKGNPTGY
jgi:hypothetical protein